MVRKGDRNVVRIISGKWKGRKLVVPNRPGLRPSLGRSRETLFNWLVADVPGARCVDLFAGSGALGFEAESRGAGQLTLIEADRTAASSLKASASALGSTAEIRCERAERYLRSCDAADIWFLDPPFDSGLLASTLMTLGDRELAPELVYAEHGRRDEPDLDGWEVLRSQRTGDAVGVLLRRI